MTTFLKLSFSVILILISVGCVPYMTDYYYIELEENDHTSVSNFGEQTGRNFTNHKVMPMAYQLKNEQYELDMTIIQGRLDIHMTVSLANKSQGLDIVPLRSDKSCGGFRKNHVDDNFIYIWGIVRDNCISISYDLELEPNPVLSFMVVDSNGQTVGIEKLHYNIKKNGKHLNFDAI